jgi:DNA adenine methylase
MTTETSMTTETLERSLERGGCSAPSRGSAPVERPLVRYHGGKWELAPWIISHFPTHRVYVEPFGGGASVLLQKPRCYAEIYNDLDGEMVNLFRVVRERGADLLAAIETTPFSRAEFQTAYEPTTDSLEWARRVLMRSHFGHAGDGTHGRVTGFRSRSVNSGTHPGMQWRTFPDSVAAIVDRLRGVVIENRDAVEVILQHDHKETLYYIDPPYVPETRDAGKDYRHEMTVEQHRRLAEVLHEVAGGVILSGYPSTLYEELYGDWRRVERKALAEGARERVEVLWMRCETPERDLFRGEAQNGAGERPPPTTKKETNEK